MLSLTPYGLADGSPDPAALLRGNPNLQMSPDRTPSPHQPQRAGIWPDSYPVVPNVFLAPGLAPSGERSGYPVPAALVLGSTTRCSANPPDEAQSPAAQTTAHAPLSGYVARPWLSPATSQSLRDSFGPFIPLLPSTMGSSIFVSGSEVPHGSWAAGVVSPPAGPVPSARQSHPQRRHPFRSPFRSSAAPITDSDDVTLPYPRRKRAPPRKCKSLSASHVTALPRLVSRGCLVVNTINFFCSTIW